MSYLRKRGEKWYYTIETKNDDGTRKKVERVGGRTKKEADAAYHAALTSCNCYGEFKEPKNITVKEYFEEWLHGYVEVNLKQNTVDSYRSKIDQHIIPALGNLKLYKVSPLFLQKFINDKKETYSRGTLKVLLAVLKKAFADAVQPYAYIKINPAEYIKVPKYDEPEEEAHVFSRDQLKTLFGNFDSKHLFYMPIMLSYHTGMRLGECLALSWHEVDLAEKTVSVLYTMLDKSGKPQLSATPKTKSSIRTIPFGKDLYKILKAQRAKQAANRLEYGKYYSKTDFVCAHEDGTPITSNDMRYFGMYCKEKFGAGSFHSLRHTHATMLLENGLDIEYVSKRLGHSSIVITVKTYSHITKKRHDQAIKLLDKIL